MHIIPKRISHVPSIMIGGAFRMKHDWSGSGLVFPACIVSVLLLCQPWVMAGSVPEPGRLVVPASRQSNNASMVPEVPLGLALPDLPPEYMVLTPDSFKEEIKPLVLHRVKLGLYPVVYTFEDIGYVMNGSDLPRKVHDFLRAKHEENPSLQWLLIVGDSEFLAPRQLWHYAADRGQPFGSYYYSDVYYAGLDSDWDDDKDGKYGEITVYGEYEADLAWDLYVGRLPASNETQVVNYVSKLIRYEVNPPIGTWMKRFLNWGSLMEPPNLDEGVYKYFDYKSNAYKVCEQVREELPGHLLVQNLYDYPQLEGGNYTPLDGRDTLHRGNMLEQFNSGASLLNFVGQARYEAYALNDYGPPTGFGDNYDWNEPLTYLDHSVFLNGDMMPFMYASTCDTAKFFRLLWNGTIEDNDATLETYLTSENGGLIGFISSTGTSARGEEQNKSWGNWYLDRLFWDLFLKEGETRPGRALYILKRIYEDDWFSPYLPIKETILGMIYTYILLGDPYVDVYTDTVKRFMLPGVLTTPFYNGEHTVRFQVKDRDLNVVGYPSVTFYNGAVHTTVTGNAQGWVNTTLDLQGTKTLNVTLSGHNMVPSFYVYDVLPAISDPSISGDEIFMEPADPEHGENVNITVTVRNLGGADANGVRLSVLFVGGNGDPTTLFQEIGIGDLAPEAYYEHRFMWKVRAGDHSFRFTALSDSPEIDPFNDEALFTVSTPAPMFQLTSTSGVIMPSNVLRPGQQAEVIYGVYNSGEVPGDIGLGLRAGITEANGTGLTMIDLAPDLLLGGILPMTWRNGTISFNAPSETCILFVVPDPDDMYPVDFVGEPSETLLYVNGPPIVLSHPEVQFLEDSVNDLVRLDSSVMDTDNGTGELSFTIVSAGTLAASIVAHGENMTYLEVTPPRDWFGSADISIDVDDGLGAVRLVVNVTIVPVNDPPVVLDAVLGVIELALTEDHAYEGTIRAYDIEGGLLAFSSPGAPFALDPVTGAIDWTPGQSDIGERDHTVSVSDAQGGETVFILRVTVMEVNDPPVLGRIPDIVLTVGETDRFKVNVSDEEGGSLVLTADLSFVRFDEDGYCHLNGSADHIGVNLVTIEVFDGLNSVYGSFNVTIEEADGGDDGYDKDVLQIVMAAAGLALVLFGLLLLVFVLIRRKAGARKAEEEALEADAMYLDDIDREGPGGGEVVPSDEE